LKSDEKVSNSRRKGKLETEIIIEMSLTFDSHPLSNGELKSDVITGLMRRALFNKKVRIVNYK
jgi:hypothetical protein